MMNNNTNNNNNNNVMTIAAPDSKEANFASIMLAARAAGNTCAIKRDAVEGVLGIAFDEYKGAFIECMEGLNKLFVARSNKADNELDMQREAFAALAKCFAFAGALAVNADLEDLYTTFRRVGKTKDTKDSVGNVIAKGDAYTGMVGKETFRKRVEMHIGARLAGKSLRGGNEVVMTEEEKRKMQKRIDKFHTARLKEQEEAAKKAEEEKKKRDEEYARAVGAAPAKKKASTKKAPAKKEEAA